MIDPMKILSSEKKTFILKSKWMPKASKNLTYKRTKEQLSRVNMAEKYN